MRRAAGLALALCACGAAAAGKRDAGPGDAAAAVSDARLSDAAVGCHVAVQVSPALPVAPQKMTATASVSGAFSFVTIDWNVIGPEGNVPFTVNESGLSIVFDADVPGPYLFALSAMDGNRICSIDAPTLNVRALASNESLVRLRFTPLPDQGVPPQLDAQTVTLVGGADNSLPQARVLQQGVTVSGLVTGPAGGQPAYLRLVGDLSGALELYAGTSGLYFGQVPLTSYDVLVVPYGSTLPAQLFAGVQPARIASGFALDAGDPVSGVLLDGDGHPLSGARIAVAAGALPPLVVGTGSDGGFVAHARLAAGPLALTAIPPGTLPHLATPAVVAGAGAHLELRLPAADPVAVALTAHDSAGGPLAGARVTLYAADVPPGGSLSVDSGAPIGCPSSARLTVVAGAGGALPPLQLPRAAWQAFVEPPLDSDDVLGTNPFDLRETVPDVVASAPPRVTRVTVRARGAALGGARVFAIARGLQGIATGTVVAATTDPNGAVDLPLVPTMRYDLIIDPPLGIRLARARATLDGTATSLAVTLPAALKLSGTVAFPSGPGQAGVRVEALCITCVEGEDPAQPLAETITVPGGAFDLWLRDPGTTDTIAP